MTIPKADKPEVLGSEPFKCRSVLSLDGRCPLLFDRQNLCSHCFEVAFAFRGATASHAKKNSRDKCLSGYRNSSHIKPAWIRRA
jgi:hypothetical protein